MNINYRSIITHFAAWLVAPTVVFSMTPPDYFWYTVVGACMILGIMYLCYPAVKSLPYAAIGLAIAILIGIYI